jgi:hypothetical protein
VNQQQASLGQTIDYIVDHLVSAEKERPLIDLEWAKTGVRTRGEP